MANIEQDGAARKFLADALAENGQLASAAAIRNNQLGFDYGIAPIVALRAITQALASRGDGGALKPAPRFDADGFDHHAPCPICNGIEGCSHSVAERKCATPGDGEDNDLRQKLLGRAQFLRDRGEIKSPELLERAAAALTNAGRGSVVEECAIAARDALLAQEWPPQDGDRQIDAVLEAIRNLKDEK